jgi:hypothetical protein
MIILTFPQDIIKAMDSKDNDKSKMCICVLHDHKHTEISYILLKAEPVPLHATKALGGRGGIAPTHS